ncbi:YraN family protein [Lacrimispora aerotolerans]|uniref:YraN family protein n=1 Tax=Lacrimispora aerotolerans TaxID=36832 RepID=UPI000479536B|nr:YraN family protein [Lacrimispora aerotolerans]
MKSNREIGTEYEVVAADYLQKAGYEILIHNYKNKMGEIDLIAKDGNQLVFIEVKYRKNLSKGDPAEAVDGRKQLRIRNAARGYLYFNRYGEDTPCRFDVVTILGEEIRLIKDAF